MIAAVKLSFLSSEDCKIVTNSKIVDKLITERLKINERWAAHPWCYWCTTLIDLTEILIDSNGAQVLTIFESA